jgi:hypothetical protein
MPEVREIASTMVLVHLKEGEDLKCLLDIVKENPNRQILVSIGEQTIDDVLAEAKKVTDNNNHVFDPSLIENLFALDVKDTAAMRRIGGDYSGDALMRRGVIPPTPSNNPQIGRLGQVKRLSRKR